MAASGWFVLLVVAGVIPVVAIGTHWALWAWLGIVAVLGGIDLALAASPRRVRLERELPARVRLGETVASRVIVTNAGRRTLRGLLRDAWSPSAQARPRRATIQVPPGERRSVTTQLTPFRRGTRAAGDVTIRAFGPMRLLARQATASVPGAIVVLPAFHARKHLPSRLARLRELDGATSLMVRGQGTEFDSLRDYVRGDDVRSIDWRATARRSGGGAEPHLVVRTWRPERDRRVVIILDTGRSSAARIADETRLDTGYETALLLGALASAAGDHVDLLLVDRRVRARVQGASGPELLSRMVDAMADVDPELIEPDWAALPSLVRSATSHRALVVIGTTAEAPEAARSLLGVLPELTRRHLVLLASVADPGVVALSQQRGRLSEVYLAAAAERALADQRRMAAAVQRLGGDFVSAAPQDLPPAVADRYLAYKAAGRL
ncbi:MAG TPA: DUF58 domain-containing protein [Microbacteriaceae bacterium]|nr:DUF58 domain-containing protein [Microbacteriaceae bacterium]